MWCTVPTCSYTTKHVFRTQIDMRSFWRIGSLAIVQVVMVCVPWPFSTVIMLSVFRLAFSAGDVFHDRGTRRRGKRVRRWWIQRWSSTTGNQ